jgi:hypothetical protein
MAEVQKRHSADFLDVRCCPAGPIQLAYCRSCMPKILAPGFPNTIRGPIYLGAVVALKRRRPSVGPDLVPRQPQDCDRPEPGIFPGARVQGSSESRPISARFSWMLLSFLSGSRERCQYRASEVMIAPGRAIQDMGADRSRSSAEHVPPVPSQKGAAPSIVSY